MLKEISKEEIMRDGMKLMESWKRSKEGEVDHDKI